ncbi:BTAD domain-containing putative transcriptional regulator [Conexibacter sp. SYSU D00693]|uniref:BTAD domain-containing putative transcriptional regulator n=1 Tax=Conexibacter sp. SYSU D00693 TaxID=2812560 RepID=UPI00196A63A3|nr:BTAD domain-containing putative transcriptional regulator [Conexibacter sp. SYSU D00693]
MIQAKLAVPPLPDHFAERPRLRERLVALLQSKRLVLLAATAGSGKTTALVEALASADTEVAWLTVDRSDAAPGRLVTYVEAALARVVPEVEGVATDAMAAAIPQPEAAGLAAEAVGDRPLTVVFDELEQLGDADEPWAIVDAVLRYAPPAVRFVLVSRRALPSSLRAVRAADIAVLGDRDLAFTAEEAGRALERCGKSGADAEHAVRTTDGWVTGVLFEAWRSGGALEGLGGETDPLYGYLASQILAELQPHQREFLVVTSLLDEVTAARASALALPDAAQRLRELRAVHLPATWSADGRTLRLHSYLRDFLRAELQDRDEAEVHRLRLAHAQRLERERHDELATEELLALGELEAALRPAERAIIPVVERLDVEVAERWLATLAPVRRLVASRLDVAELMIGVAHDQPARASALIDRLGEAGQRDALARADERAPWLVIWCLLFMARFDEAEALLEHVDAGAEQDVVRMTMGAVMDLPDAPTDVVVGDLGPLHAMAHVALFCRGQLTALTEARATRWLSVMEGPWQIAALRALGKTSEALELLLPALERPLNRQPLLTWAAPEVFLDAGRHDEAAAVIEEGRRLAFAGGGPPWQAGARLAEAKYALRVDRDPERARAALEAPECVRAAEQMTFIAELADTWYGLALLLEDRDDEALTRLRRVASSMQHNKRLLELPCAAVWLAEAEWRAGNEEAADRAADTALAAAGAQGSNHLLLQALGRFPSVASRRLDAERDRDSAWHQVARSLSAAAVEVAGVRARVELLDLGQAVLRVDGEDQRPRIAKSYEALAYLSTAPGRRAPREALLEALFGERRDDGAKAYLRQALHWLRKTLPPEAISVQDGVAHLRPDVGVRAQSQDVEVRLLEAARLRGQERLDAALPALEALEGEYLPGPRGPWALERREQLRSTATEHRYETATVAFDLGRYDRAADLVEEVLGHEPFREAAWRLRMRVLEALGDDDAVLRAFHACEQALAEFGAAPSSSTRRLLEALRR